MTLIVRLWQAGLQQMHKEQSMLELYSAYDAITQDLHAAPQEKNAWKLFTFNAIIWQQNKKDIGWIIDKTRLFRITGIYNKELKKWNKRQTSLVAQLTSGIFNWIHKNDKTLVQITFLKDKLEVEGVVAMPILETM